jgi:hypothetical protein
MSVTSDAKVRLAVHTACAEFEAAVEHDLES